MVDVLVAIGKAGAVAFAVCLMVWAVWAIVRGRWPGDNDRGPHPGG